MNKKQILILGDVITFAIVTLIGFVSHGETEILYLPRFLAVYIPLLIAWFLLINWFGLLNQETVKETKKLLLIPLAMLFIIPLAAIIRGFILNSPILPSFVIAFFATNTIGIFIWRLIYKLIHRSDS